MKEKIYTVEIMFNCRDGYTVANVYKSNLDLLQKWYLGNSMVSHALITCSNKTYMMHKNNISWISYAEIPEGGNK